MKTDGQPLKGVAYYRVSTEEQGESGRGLERQQRNVRAYFVENGIELVEEFSDDCSGTIDMGERKDGKRMLEILRQGEVDMVVCDTVCRATRPKYDEVEFIILRYNLKKWFGVDLVCLDASSTGDAFADNIIGLAKAKGAKEEREKIATRMNEGKRDKARAGEWVGSTPPPYGYKAVSKPKPSGRGKDVHLGVVPYEAEIVRRIYHKYTGIGEKQVPLTQIAEWLNGEGILPPGRPGRGKTATSWHRNTVRNILKRRVYLGEFYYTGIRIDFPHLAIIDESLWEAAQAQRIANRKHSKRNRKRDYLLAGGLMRCTCSWGMYGRAVLKRDKVNEFLYYDCCQQTGERHMNECHEPVVRVDVVDRIVWDWLYNLLKDDVALDEGLDEMAAQREDELEPKRRELESLEELIAQAERRIVRLVSSFGDEEDETVAATLTTRVRELAREKTALIAKRDRLAAEIEQWEVSEALRAEIKRTVDKIRISGMLDRGLYEDKRFLLTTLDVQVQVKYREGRRGVYVTCGIKAEGEWLSIELSESRPTSR